MDDGPLANKLAAIADAIAEAGRTAPDDLGPTDVAALLAIVAREPMTVGEVAEAAALSQSAAVRLVDRLERAWLVQRRRRVAREVLVEATARGRKRAAMLASHRLEKAAHFLRGLDGAERDLLGALIDRMIAGRRGEGGGSAGFDLSRHCRFCDRGLCDCGLHETPGGDQAGGGLV